MTLLAKMRLVLGMFMFGTLIYGSSYFAFNLTVKKSVGTKITHFLESTRG